MGHPTACDLAGQMRVQVQEEQEKYGEDTSQGQVEEEPLENLNVAYNLGDYLKKDFGTTEPLIGSENNALLVRGEGMFIPGRSGTGKTQFIADMAIKVAAGYDILKYRTVFPLRVLIYQAELPPQFFQKRLIALTDGYMLADPDRMAMAIENITIIHVKKPFDMYHDGGNAVDIVSMDVEDSQADLVIVDPFLSFYSGDENNNPEVRRSLDKFKVGIAEKYGCGLIITDHQTKYSNVTPGQETAMRGAGAKHDWAATVVALAVKKTPAGEHGHFLRATVDKLRYGPKPRDPFVLRRDDFTFMHSVWNGVDISGQKIAVALDDAGSGLSFSKMTNMISEKFSLSTHVARGLIKDAVDDGWIITSNGPRKAIIHDLGDKYLTQRPSV